MNYIHKVIQNNLKLSILPPFPLYIYIYIYIYLYYNNTNMYLFKSYIYKLNTIQISDTHGTFKK